MRNRTLVFLALLGSASAAAAQEGLRVPARNGAGLDPTYAAGWLSPQRERFGTAYDRFGYGPSNWRDSIGFAPSQRMQWSYALGARSTFSMSYANGRDFNADPVAGPDVRQFGLSGRYSLAPDWSFSAETVSRDPGALLRLQDFRIGVRRQF